MSEKKEHWLRSPWTVGIGTTQLSFVFMMLYDLLKHKPILSTVTLALKWSGNLICGILNFNLKIWWLLLGFAVLTLLLITYFYFFSQSIEDVIEKNKPDRTSGVLKKWEWRWKWEWSNYHKEWQIIELEALCPICKTTMMERPPSAFSSSYNYNCPRCDYHSSISDTEDPIKIERLIIDNIKREKISNS